jgi:hypothetical protein
MLSFLCLRVFVDGMLCLPMQMNWASEFWSHRIAPGCFILERQGAMKADTFFCADMIGIFTLPDFFRGQSLKDQISKRKAELFLSPWISRQHVMFIHKTELRLGILVQLCWSCFFWTRWFHISITKI